MSLATLLERIRSQAQGELPIVTVEEFFEGNEGELAAASIGCNLSPHPGIEAFARVIRAVSARPEVHSVWMGITEDMGDELWPFCDQVYVVTHASLEDVDGWFRELSADPAYEASPSPLAGRVDVPAQASVFTVWWD